MQMLSHAKADQLLMPLGMKIGGWNELTSVHSGAVTHRAYSPPSNALELYVVAYRLSAWIVSGEWTLLQVDNSTSPTDDELRVFEKLVLAGQQEWRIGNQRTFLFEGSSDSESQSLKTTVVLLIHFALLFGWHVHLASEASLHGHRLALQDGVVYFFGDAQAIETADSLVKSMAADPQNLTS